MTTGTVTMTEAAPYSPHSDPMLDSNDLSPSGSVHISVSCRICAATTYSVQAVINEKRAVITSAGAASGSMIMRKAWNWLHPSILPASSKLVGIVS